MHEYLTWLSSRRVYPPRFTFDARAKQNDDSERTSSEKSVLEFQSLYMHKEVFRHLHVLDFSASEGALREADSKVTTIIEASGSTLQEAIIRLQDHEVAFEALRRHSANLQSLRVSNVVLKLNMSLATNAYPMIQTLSHLRELSLSSCRIDSLAFATALQESRISELYLDFLHVTEKVTEYPNGTNVLESLHMQHCQVPIEFANNCLRTRAGLRHLLLHPEIKGISATRIRNMDCKCNDATCEAISLWSPNIADVTLKERYDLKSFHINPDDRTAITASGLRKLLQLTNLKIFVLPGRLAMEQDEMVIVANECVEYLNNSSKLIEFGVNFEGVGAEAVYSAISSQSLKEIHLEVSPSLTDAVIERIVFQCRNLTCIVIKGNADLIALHNRDRTWTGPTAASIRAIGYHCRNLEHLHLWSDIFQPEAIRALAASIPRRSRPLDLFVHKRHDKDFNKAVKDFKEEQKLYFDLADKFT
jgi:hypothetical protein